MKREEKLQYENDAKHFKIYKKPSITIANWCQYLKNYFVNYTSLYALQKQLFSANKT